MVQLELNESIIFPVSKQHDEGLFAVEVALLSHNIHFESPQGEDDPIGGHFMVLQTPDVVQHIEGMEVVNFGLQGAFIHTSALSLCSKNLTTLCLYLYRLFGVLSNPSSLVQEHSFCDCQEYHSQFKSVVCGHPWYAQHNCNGNHCL